MIQTSAGGVIDAAVPARGESGTAFLIPHVVLKIEQDGAFLQQLQARLPLPQYMKPSILIPIAKLPTNDSGKLDRKALAALHATGPGYPTNSKDLTSAQAEMKALWARVIPGELSASHEIGPTTDFFHVGGTFLLLVNL